MYPAPSRSSGSPSAAAGVIVSLGGFLATRYADCCPDHRCSCDCGCRAHSHYRRCADCAHDRHRASRAVVVPITAQAAIAFDEWPPPPAPGRLAHLLPAPRGPREVEP